jgi:hypothetical protein
LTLNAKTGEVTIHATHLSSTRREPVSGEQVVSVPYGNTREGRSSVSDDSKRSSVLR